MSEHLSNSQRSVGRGTGRGLASAHAVSTSPPLKSRADRATMTSPTPPQKRLPQPERKSGAERARPLPPPKARGAAPRASGGESPDTEAPVAPPKKEPRK